MMRLTRTTCATLLAAAALAGFSAGELLAGATAPTAPGPVVAPGPSFAPGPIVVPQGLPESKRQVAQATPQASSQPPPGACSGIAEAQCGTVAGCVWLPGYKVKGGADVVGYCRPAPKSLTGRRPATPQ